MRERSQPAYYQCWWIARAYAWHGWIIFLYLYLSLSLSISISLYICVCACKCVCLWIWYHHNITKFNKVQANIPIPIWSTTSSVTRWQHEIYTVYLPNISTMIFYITSPSINRNFILITNNNIHIIYHLCYIFFLIPSSFTKYLLHLNNTFSIMIQFWWEILCDLIQITVGWSPHFLH